MTTDWVRGDHTGLSFPAHTVALRRGDAGFLTEAFRAFGALDDGNDVHAVDRLEEVAGGSTGRKAILDVRYAAPGPPGELFVKFSRDFDDPVRDRGRTQMASEVRFAALAQTRGFPIEVPTTLFADYQRQSGTGLLITQRIPFGRNGIEPQYHKCLDYQMPGPAEHYRALLTAIARLAGAHRGGRLPRQLVAQFPVDLQAATVGDRVAFTSDQLDRRLTRLRGFVEGHPGLFAANVRSPLFLTRLRAQAHELASREAEIWCYLRDTSDYIALSHWNANVDNAWFWRDADDELRCGLLDWGCVSQLNMAMAVWGALSGAETALWNDDLDGLLATFCDEIHSSGGPRLEPAALRRQLVLYACLMGVSWLLDVPALIHSRVPDTGPQTTRLDPRIKGDERVRAPLQMLTNVLNVWATRGLDESLRVL